MAIYSGLIYPWKIVIFHSHLKLPEGGYHYWKSVHRTVTFLIDSFDDSFVAPSFRLNITAGLFFDRRSIESERYPLVNKHSYRKWPFIVDFPIEIGDFL